jgi:hypothetical protein
VLQDIYIPDDVLAQLEKALTENHRRSDAEKKEQRHNPALLSSSVPSLKIF